MDYLIGTVFAITPLRLLIRKCLPGTGEGPNEEAMKKAFVTLYGRANGDGKEVKACMYFPNDPGYVDTARIVGECGMCFVKESVDKQGGMWSPASCFGDVLLERLVKSGSEFCYIE